MKTLSRQISLVCALVMFLSTGVSIRPLSSQAIGSQIVTLVRGTSTLVNQPSQIARLSIGDPEVADAVAVSPSEVLVNARSLGSTTLIVWDEAGNRRLYTVEVTADATALDRQMRVLFPGDPIGVTATGNLIILTGRVGSASVARRALEIARATGATVIDNLTIPPARQVMLRVRFAEVTRQAGEHFDAGLSIGDTDALLRPDRILSAGDRTFESLSDGLAQLFLFEDDIQLGLVIDAMRERGTFRSLAEPNLVTLEGQEASFLAGGEFPYPVPQGGENNNTTITFKEFGVRLTFTPNVTMAGNIRLHVAPEVSQLDFANGLQFAGFQVPSLLTRRAETHVELRPGQTFAIAGLMDNMTQASEGRIPFLGDLPILGNFFRSKDAEQRRTELLVLVTPLIVEPLDVAPPLPTGEPEEWEWAPNIREGMEASPRVIGDPVPAARQ